MITFKNALLSLYLYLVKRTEEGSHHIPLFGIVMMINFPLFGVLWKFEFFQFDEEFFLRLAAALVCLILASSQFWPRLLLKFLPVYWYLTLLFCLPFFFTYATLLNQVTTHWLMNCITAFFFLLLLTNIFDALVLLSIGISLAIISYSYLAGHSLYEIPKHSPLSLYSLNSTMFAVIVIGFLFTKKSELSLRDLYRGFQTDNKYPSSVRFDFLETAHALPGNFNGGDNGMPLPLEKNVIANEVYVLDAKNFSIFSIKYFLKKITKNYVSNLNKHHFIHLSLTSDFFVWMEGKVLWHFLWNFLTNSMKNIEKNGYGDINIWIVLGKEEDDFNYVHLKNFALNLEEKQHSFHDFYFNKQPVMSQKGLDIEAVMEMAGGMISHENDLSNYSHYILKFPKVD